MNLKASVLGGEIPTQERLMAGIRYKTLINELLDPNKNHSGDINDGFTHDLISFLVEHNEFHNDPNVIIIFRRFNCRQNIKTGVGYNSITLSNSTIELSRKVPNTRELPPVSYSLKLQNYVNIPTIQMSSDES